MLLTEKMKSKKFSHNENLVIDFILKKEDKIKNYTTTEIAQETYTSTSTIIRIAKKLGYQGWVELKDAYLNELGYLKTHFINIDVNVPFSKDDTVSQISSKIAQLHIESAKDTLELIDTQMITSATSLILNSKKIHIFAVSNLYYIAENFAFNLSRINKDVCIDPIQDNMYHNAMMLTKNDCAICISYTGETKSILDVAKSLYENNIPIIAITSIGNNCLERYANIVLHVCTREKSITKIAGFTSIHSISLIFDILYSVIFSANYQHNLDYKTKTAKAVETNRNINVEIIKD